MPQRSKERTPRQTEEKKINKEVHFVDIKAGFTIIGKQRQPGMHECMTVQINTSNNQFKALLDTGINMNVLCQDIYRQLLQDDILDQENCNFSIKGISDKPVQLIKKIYMKTYMYGLDLGINEFYVLDKETDNHDIILGLQFMKDNNIVLHPHRQSIEQKFSNEHRREVFLEVQGQQIKKIYRGEEILAAEDVTLKTNEPTLVKVTWRRKDVQLDKENIMFIDGESAHLKIRRSAHVFDGVLDTNKMKICVQPKIGIDYRNHRIHKGDTLAKAYSILEVKVANLENENTHKWKKQKMNEELDFGKNLTPTQRQKAIISRDNTDIGVSNLPPFKIELSDNIPIYQKPRHFPPPVTEEIENHCQDLYRLDLIEETESPWNSPIVPVRKPDGTLRICIDYRKVNEKTIKNRFPMKLISDCV